MTLLIIKLLVTIVVVVGLSSIAERVSPKVAGVLAGYPLGSSIVLFFFGVEHGAKFAAQSAVYMTAGLVAELIFLFCYFKASTFTNEKKDIITPSLIALVGFFLVVWIIHFLPLNPLLAVIIFFIAILVSIYLFRSIPDERILERKQLNPMVVLLRAILAGGIILIITGSAYIIGPTWSGLLGAFPTTLYPLILIIHWTYGKEYAHTFIKHVPRGLGSLLIYVICVMSVYPVLGVYWGTLASLAGATIYLIIYNRLQHH